MSSETLFRIQLAFGYVTWLLCFSAYIWPRLKAMDRFAAQRAIATLHSFRFFGLVFLLPGVVGPNLPAGFATFAAYASEAGFNRVFGCPPAQFRRSHNASQTK